jgi:DNA-binding LacI/PurR family transcriptional regulator
VVGLNHTSEESVEESVGGPYRRALDERFSERFPFDAVLCASDEGAAAMIKWLRRRGLNVPGDVAVRGFNGAEWGESMSPPLASVDRRDEAVGTEIDRMVFARLKNPDLPPQRRTIPMRMIWRESAGGHSNRSKSFLEDAL